jgi:hypothetical protein
MIVKLSVLRPLADRDVRAPFTRALNKKRAAPEWNGPEFFVGG